MCASGLDPQHEHAQHEHARQEHRARLEGRYRDLVLRRLPELARDQRWVVTADHCFGRIVLDHAVGGCWYDVLDRRRSPAFAQLDDERLAVAVGLAERIATEGDTLLRELDRQSLAWRGKRPKRA
jgi:proline racemase